MLYTFPESVSNSWASFETASQVFFDPMPIMEKSASCPFTLRIATALLEVGSGSGSTPGSVRADKSPHRASNGNRSRRLFMELIKPTTPSKYQKAGGYRTEG